MAIKAQMHHQKFQNSGEISKTAALSKSEALANKYGGKHIKGQRP